MALQSIPGRGLYIPKHEYLSRGPSFNSAVIDATGEKYAWIGRVWNKDGTTKSIRKVGFLFGTVVKAGGSALTVSLQNVSLTVGPIYVPDETQDQTVAIANGDAGFATNAWYQTGALSADRSVAFGELLAVVVEYDGGGRLGADAVNFRNLGNADTASFGSHGPVHKTGGTWAADANVPNILLEFSDGTFGTLDNAFPVKESTFLQFKQDTGGADEYALRFSQPFPCKVDGCWFTLALAASTSDFSVVLYEGTTALETVAIDANASAAAGDSPRFWWVTFSQSISLAKDTVYRLAIKPTQTTSTVNLYYFTVNAANHLQAHDGGAEFFESNRLNEGAWSDDTTVRPFMGVRISALDDGVGGGGQSSIYVETSEVFWK